MRINGFSDEISKDKIYIYGAGTISDIVYYVLERKGISNEVQCFIVTALGGNVSKKWDRDVLEIKNVYESIGKDQVIVAVNDALREEIVDILHEYNVNNIVLIDSKSVIDAFYQELYKYPINVKKVLLQNQQGQGYGCNPKYIAEALRAKDNTIDLVWAVSSYEKKLPTYIRPVLYGSFDYYKELATSRLWIDNARKPLSIRKREGQYYIQAWHGAAPIKKVEADAVSSLPDFYIKAAKHDSQMADLFLSGSSFYTDLYRKSFWYTGEVMEVGLPRQDIFFNNNSGIKRKIFEKYGIGESEKIILYAPTFRTHNNTECYDLDIERIKEAFKKKTGCHYTVLVSRHPVNYQKYNFPESSQYISVEDYDDFEELLAVADILISDYSGCVYDFSFTGKPVFLYQKDYEDYMKDRDFYIPMEKLPYIRAKTNEEMEQRIMRFEYDQYKSNIKNFMDSMNNYDDGFASIKVANHIVEKVLK